MSDQHFSPGDELDLTGEGLQPTTADFLITGVEIQDVDAGQRWKLYFEPIGQEIDNLPNNQAQDSGYLTHESEPDYVRMGRGILKRIAKAALGRTNFKLSELEGQIVNAQVSEDDAGFTRMRRYKTAQQG